MFSAVVNLVRMMIDARNLKLHRHSCIAKSSKSEEGKRKGGESEETKSKQNTFVIQMNDSMTTE